MVFAAFCEMRDDPLAGDVCTLPTLSPLEHRESHSHETTRPPGRPMS